VAVKVVPDHELTAMGWEVYPPGLREVLARVQREYAPAPIYITENGAAYADGTGPDGPHADARRVEYLGAHVEAARQAIAEGAELRGYFVWSLMDNFEWAQGLSKRFGLFHVDFATQRRTPRRSAHWYRDLVARETADPAVPQRGMRAFP
jgi:beta-glucosidase